MSNFVDVGDNVSFDHRTVILIDYSCGGGYIKIRGYRFRGGEWYNGSVFFSWLKSRGEPVG